MPQGERSALATLDDALTVFVPLRPRLFGIAYRVVGSGSEAEDVVQEVWLRWQRTDRSVVAEPSAFLARTTTRLAINVTHSARRRRETCVGSWLPEPADSGADPARDAETAEALARALLLVLERLNSTERAAYLLREAFDYPYHRIGDLLRLTPVNTRQLVCRARKHLSTARGEPVTAAEHRRLLRTFTEAARSGDVDSLERLLKHDVVRRPVGERNGARAGRSRRRPAAKRPAGPRCATPRPSVPGRAPAARTTGHTPSR